MPNVVIIGNDIAAYIAALEVQKNGHQVFLVNPRHTLSPSKPIVTQHSIQLLKQALGEDGELELQRNNAITKQQDDCYEISSSSAVIDKLNIKLGIERVTRQENLENIDKPDAVLVTEACTTRLPWDKNATVYINSQLDLNIRINQAQLFAALPLDIDKRQRTGGVFAATYESLNATLKIYELAQKYLNGDVDNPNLTEKTHQEIYNYFEKTDKTKPEKIIDRLRNVRKAFPNRQQTGGKTVNFYMDQVRSAFILYRDKPSEFVKALIKIANDIESANYSGASPYKGKNLFEDLSLFRQEIFHQYADDNVEEFNSLYPEPENSEEKTLYKAIILDTFDNKTKFYARYLYKQLIADPELQLQAIFNANSVPRDILGKKLQALTAKLKAFGVDEQQIEQINNFASEATFTDAIAKKVFSNDFAIQFNQQQTGKEENRRRIEALIEKVRLGDQTIIKLENIPLDKLPENLTKGRAPNLKTVAIVNCELTEVPAQLNQFEQLEVLNLSNNKLITSLPLILPTKLTGLNISGTGINIVPVQELKSLQNAMLATANSLTLTVLPNQFEPLQTNWHAGTGLHDNVVRAINECMRPAERIRLSQDQFNKITDLLTNLGRQATKQNKLDYLITQTGYENAVRWELDELKILFKIMKQVQEGNNIGTVSVTVDSQVAQNLDVQSLVSMREERHTWIRSNTHANTSKWQNIMRVVKEQMIDRLERKVREAADHANPDVAVLDVSDKVSTLVGYQTGRINSFFGKTTSEQIYQEKILKAFRR